MVGAKIQGCQPLPQLSDVLLDAVLHDLGPVPHLPQVAVDAVR